MLAVEEKSKTKRNGLVFHSTFRQGLIEKPLQSPFTTLVRGTEGGGRADALLAGC